MIWLETSQFQNGTHTSLCLVFQDADSRELPPSRPCLPCLGWALHPTFPDSPCGQAPRLFSLQHLICRCLVLYAVAKSINDFPVILAIVSMAQNKQCVFLYLIYAYYVLIIPSDVCASIPFNLFLRGVFSVIVYLAVLSLQCQITSVICSFFWILIPAVGMKVARSGTQHLGAFAFSCNVVWGFILLKIWGLACLANFYFHSVIACFLHFCSEFCFPHTIKCLCFCFLLAFFFLFSFNNLDLFLAFVLPSEYYFRGWSSYRCCSNLNIWMIWRKV